jgi:quercetin dioxygenase-like cupin family protein
MELARRSIVFAAASTAAHSQQPAGRPQNSMKQLPLQTTIGEGKDRQMELLFEGPRRKLIQITLRNGAVLARHSAPVPITIQCVAGAGTLYVGEAREAITWQPGALVTIEPGIIHEIKASPAVSFLLTQFTGD